MNITSLLNRIQDINKKYEQFAKLSGENFNVFSVLGLGSAEVMHSQFIAELLNPNGSHGQGFIYLKLFLSQIGLIDIFSELQITKIVTEKHTGEIDKDYNEGGRIDIYIEHPDRNIIIENKIFAADQLNQLYRYHQFDKKACILYLSLEGSRPSNESLGSLDINNVKCLSYQTDIVNWLNTCIEKSTSLPIIRETLIQYRNLIKKLTNQCSSKDKEVEVAELLLNSEENFQTAQDIANTINSIAKVQEHVVTQIRNKICAKYRSKVADLILFSFRGYEIKLNISYKYDWFHYGIFPSKNNKMGFSYDEELKDIDRLLHKYFDTKYPTENPDRRFAELSEYCKKYRDGDKNKFIKGYYRSPENARNYFFWIPFNKSEDGINYAFYKNEMTFKDYAWLYNSDNQTKLVNYALGLCEEFIHFMKENVKDMDIIFLV